MPVIAIPRILREKLGEEIVDSLIELFNKSEERVKEDVFTLSAEKFERRLSQEISGVRSDLAILEGKFETRITQETSKLDKRITEEVSMLEVKLDKRITEETSKLRVELKEETSKLDKRITEEVSKVNERITEQVSKLRVEIKSNYASTIRWMFIFYLGQVASIIGVLFAFFKR
ncbi:MAG: coiled-coil domain-containing protein [bacterium]